MHQHHEPTQTRVNMSRRGLVQLATLGAGASLLATASWSPKARAAGKIDALLLTCMDYRLMDDIEQYMVGRGLDEKYDHIILAGASLGAVTDKFPAWNKTFWEHLDISIQLHNIPTVIVLDHRDCGAYKVILNTDLAKDPKAETHTHATHLKKLKGMIGEKYPQLKVETLLMALDGKVEAVG